MRSGAATLFGKDLIEWNEYVNWREKMTTKGPALDRRGFLAAGAGAIALAGMAPSANAAELTSDE